MAADGSDHRGQCGIIGNPQGGGFAGMANGGRVAVAEEGPMAARLRLVCRRARCMARWRACTTAACRPGPRRADRRTPNWVLTTRVICSIESPATVSAVSSARRSHGGKIKRDRVAPSRLFQAWTALTAASPATRPHFQGKTGKPAIQSSVTISGLRQRFNGLGSERQAPGTGSLMQKTPM